MSMDLPSLSSLALSSPQKRTDTYSSDYTGAENESDTLDTSYTPKVPRSPRILGAKPIARLSSRRKQKESHLHGFLAPPKLKAADPVNSVRVGKQLYIKHGLLGHGGSSQVFEATNESQEVFALKEVRTHGKDPNMVRVFQTEIETLRALRGNNRVVQLYHYEVTPQCITLVMELGDSDFCQVIRQQKLDNEQIRFYVDEILKCVQSVHKQNIVHSDLKPANFILSNGRLKLIDFGISGSIPDFTVNVHKKEQIGTVSYMAPEAFVEHTGLLGYKVGKPSDLWSCGCIIYGMIYGKPPFQRYGRAQIEAIMNPKTPIEYPPVGKNGEPVKRHMIELMQGLLCYNIEDRFTCEKALKLLIETYLVVDSSFMNDLAKYAANMGRVYQKKLKDTRATAIANEVFAQLYKVTKDE